MKRTLSALILVGSAAGLSVGCGDANNQPMGPGNPSGPTATANISVVDNAFQPSENSVNVGEVVTWTWTGSQPHNVTFDDATIGNSSTKTTGGYTRTFTTAGEYTYYCTVHGRAQMSGKVVVN